MQVLVQNPENPCYERVSEGLKPGKAVVGRFPNTTIFH